MSKMTFALAGKDRPKEVSLWCEPLGAPKDGVRKFYCLNGAWTGSFNANTGRVTVDGDGEHPSDTIEVWSGSVPRDHNWDYNAAIRWIESQL